MMLSRAQFGRQENSYYIVKDVSAEDSKSLPHVHVQAHQCTYVVRLVSGLVYLKAYIQISEQRLEVYI
jgi:glutamine amidotransferase PdxT